MERPRPLGVEGARIMLTVMLTFLGSAAISRGMLSGIALRKGEDALKGELNAAIKAIRANGSYKTLNDKYFAKFNIDVYGD